MDNTISIDDAYQYMLDNPELIRKYEQKCCVYDWPIKQLHKDPQWATWFARAVLIDRWSAAEGLIANDPDMEKSYRRYIGLMGSIGMIDHTQGKHQIKRDREEAQRHMIGAQRALRYGDQEVPWLHRNM